ncbi:MAG: 4-hydroxy-tetrahydrodipicolinate synthase [Candidatus Schekmanbacteria bacterium RIFCSPHIGHO2_02_FULL_38_11]|uniref:4-hydroxy-tetrahydrodipicolinate synthase n=1 Tax=Candidatus Schekmanbacteria bacterium RIFCSPLOWO2_12_FULL_38_15 TaxID=1817883 RepID=A0A1F7SI22_9BACT|nr:MAG: 4-hydroxy-tetrahydrodipicolinate synthase [Candidatus Schekmanbacteria bacterium GWA2_38_9]OGL50824.1 MAG: 4-hydroxy-tetrahydrodipicolinate synthase [Candidatus Schekmanbacteria bacterium RIFCSPLOWO2_02_FULL_38_14]OGL53415.1 MAG: 4-hydroxy-tetrahydrodipicolinate synthase [Candidatus Schekmanbacteria bacterium RIFCSPLOWO2_12_FULL_38_15]OGL55767.1 MAG: 4-hydroxy-tetrahydrodipicolinate synthase [Candidatus Schekmanbacteria bacterium RIFCSPHIGHO2_02_FULL_38_11]
MFSGSMVAIVTPFKNDKVDEKSFRKLIDFQIENKTSAIVPCGTTGESATLSFDEHQRVVDVAIEAARKKVPVIAGTGSNSTKEAIRLTKHAQKAGADGALLICPYYNRPTQEGLYQHFKAIAEDVDIPLILYNIPSRTGVNMLPETVARLAEIKNIVGIKEASGSLTQMSDVISLCGKEFDLISGDDNLLLPILAIGGKGVISVVANVAPLDVANLIEEFEKGNMKEAKRFHYRLSPLVSAMFYETNPVPVKAALHMMGMTTDEIRLPLCKMSEVNRKKLQSVMKKFQLI